ncbi:telomeric DNA binding protein [Coprinopsis sp. MPI-PUGE-AT-0042]|nr:telomeric DNA binding protein [Coprinopsis sp. MPI-PUGE-AT-0042]
MDADHLDEVQDLLNKIQAPIENMETVLAYLAAPLDDIGLLPPLYKRYNLEPLRKGSVNVTRHLARFQRAILQHVLPVWDDALGRRKALILVDQYFCPDLFSNALPISGDVALVAYSTLLSSTLSSYAIGLLERLSNEYPIDRLHYAVYTGNHTQAQDVAWNDCIRNFVMVPAKVANTAGMERTIPPLLENGVYFNALAARFEKLVEKLSEDPQTRRAPVYPLSHLLGKLVNVGLFPSSPPTLITQPSFFQTVLPAIRSRLHDPKSLTYFACWNQIFEILPSSLALQSILISLFASMSPVEEPLDGSSSNRANARQEAILLTQLVGSVEPPKAELWEIATTCMLSRKWSQSYARIFVCWVCGAAQGGALNVEALEAFLHNILDLWSSIEHVKHSLLSFHQYTSALLLITASYFLPNSPPLQSLSLSPSFIQGIGKYLSHQDSSIRYCGMLVGEEVARLCNKKLDFGGWDGDESGKVWARGLRQLIRARDVDADMLDERPRPVEVDEITSPAAAETTAQEPDRAHFKTAVEGYDSDDSLEGYASSQSSRSVSPTPEDLEEIEKDPSLNVGRKKVQRPVYLKQLGDLLRASGGNVKADEPHEADKIEMGLNCAEELIRKKANYGTELVENSANLVYALVSLNNNFELEDFAAKRQSALNALVVCAPRQTAPALIEEFFKNQYSADQRYVVLNALAIGARELASLPIPESKVPASRTQFPSKMLPPAMHRKYITAGQADKDLVPTLLEGISRMAIDEQRKSAENMPTIAREKVLKIRKAPTVTEMASHNKSLFTSEASTSKKTSFNQVAAEFFVAPLINRFWLFLREEQTREQRTSHMEGQQKYHGAGTGLILNPLILSHFLRTLGVLVNAAQNASEWLAIIAPDALELALNLGTKPMGRGEIEDDENGTIQEKEASVLSSALELALVILDGAIQVDGGRTIGLEQTALLLGVQEWAMKVFTSLEDGVKIPGGGGVQEAKVRSMTAGVLLKVEEITSRWKRSMLAWT